MKNRYLLAMILYSAAAVAIAIAIAPSSAFAAAVDPAPEERKLIVQEISKLLVEHYIFPDVAKKMAAHLQKKLNEDAYAKAKTPEALAAMISSELRDLSKDKHLYFAYAPDDAQDILKTSGQNEAEANKVREKLEAEARADNFGFRRVERLDGNIGYLDFRYFASPAQAGPTAIAAMNFLAACDAVIVDLRQNGGGEPEQIQLITSYFFAKPTHLNDIYTRRENKTENYWTLPFVPGPRMDKADVYVLTSKNTFSGAEEFSYNLKNLKRATIIGEVTGGGAHPTDRLVIRGKFVLAVPFARAINPISKTNWEGTGVKPDIAVPAAEAFDKAYVLALEKLKAKTTDERRKAELAWALDGLQAKAQPAVVLPAEVLSKYAGVYGERKVILQNGQLYYQRSGPQYRLVPMNERLFMVEGIGYFRLEFVVKDGKAVEVIGLYSNGAKDSFRRDS